MRTFEWRGKRRVAGVAGKRVLPEARPARSANSSGRRYSSRRPAVVVYETPRRCSRCNRKGHIARNCGPHMTEPYPQIRYIVEFFNGSEWRFFQAFLGAEAWLAEVATWTPDATKRYRCREVIVDEYGREIRERQVMPWPG